MDKTISSKKTEEHPSQIISTTTLHPPSQPTAVQLRDPTQNVLFPFVCSRAAHRHSTTWTKLLFQQARSRHRLGCLHNPCPALKIPSHAQGWVSRPQEDTRGPPPLRPTTGSGGKQFADEEQRGYQTRWLPLGFAAPRCWALRSAP